MANVADAQLGEVFDQLGAEQGDIQRTTFHIVVAERTATRLVLSVTSEPNRFQ